MDRLLTILGLTVMELLAPCASVAIVYWLWNQVYNEAYHFNPAYQTLLIPIIFVVGLWTLVMVVKYLFHLYQAITE